MTARHIYLKRMHEAQQRVYDTWLAYGGRTVIGSLALTGAVCGISKQRVHQIIGAVERRRAREQAKVARATSTT